MKTIICCLILNLVIFSACSHRLKDNEKEITETTAPQIQSSEQGIVIADTIIYDVIIKNLNPEDSWTTRCLKDLKRSLLVNKLFELVYDGKAVAYDLLTDKVIPPEELRRMEKKKKLDRDRIGKIQFTESWFYNDSLRILTKKVLSVSLGFELFDETGELIGYQHVFKVYLN